jgi:hypothetical protein
MRGFILIAHGRGVYRPGGGGYRACVRDGGRDQSPEERHWLCGGDPVWVGGLGILYTQFVNVGGGSRGQVHVMTWFAFDKEPWPAQYSSYQWHTRMGAGADGLPFNLRGL